MSLIRITHQIEKFRKKLVALSQADARAIDAQIKSAEKGALQRLSAPEADSYLEPKDNPNPLKRFFKSQTLSLTAFVQGTLTHSSRDGVVMGFGERTSYLKAYTPDELKEVIKAGRAQGYELPHFQEALLDHNRHHPSGMARYVRLAALCAPSVSRIALGIYAPFMLAITGTMRDEAQKVEAPFKPEKITKVAGTSWSANLTNQVLINGRLPKIGEPAVQVYDVNERELCELSQIQQSFWGITERAYKREHCQYFYLSNPDGLEAFVSPIAAWHKITGSPETENTLRTQLHDLSVRAADYSNPFTLDKANEAEREADLLARAERPLPSPKLFPRGL